MQPAIARTAAPTPKRALVVMTYSMFGPGVADTKNVITTNSHHVLHVMLGSHRFNKSMKATRVFFRCRIARLPGRLRRGSLPAVFRWSLSSPLAKGTDEALFVLKSCSLRHLLDGAFAAIE